MELAHGLSTPMEPMRTSSRHRVAPAAAVALLMVIVPASWSQETAGGPDYERCRYEDDSGRQAATAGDQISCQIEMWKREDPLGRELSRNPNVLMVDGSETVALHVDDRNWGKSRVLAHARAYLSAMGEFVGLRRQRVEVETTRLYFSDLSDDGAGIFREEPTSFLERIDEKEALLLEGKLDQALKDELGMSDDQIDRLSPTDKITRFRDDFLRRSVTESVGSASGLIPVKTFEAVDSEGNSSIGVVVVFSERMARVAASIADDRRIPPDPERARYPVGEWIGELSDEDLTTQFGVRLWWDERGYPVVVSFGQWGVTLGNLSNRQKDRARRAAAIQAENDARSGLVEFINVATSFSNESIRGEIVEESTKLHTGGIAEDVEFASIVDVAIEEAKTRSVANLTGLGILRTWSARHPIAADQELVGAVAYWSPAREDVIRTGLGLGTRHVPDSESRGGAESPAEPESESEPSPSGRTQSKALMDAADF